MPGVKVLFMLFAVCLLLISTVSTAVFCDKKYTVYGKVAGEHSLIIWDVEHTGECGSFESHIGLVANDRIIDFKSDYGLNLGTPFSSILDSLPSEEVIAIDAVDGRVHIGDSISISPPAYDSAFDRNWNDWVSVGSGFDSWKKTCRSPGTCSDYPSFTQTEAQLLYMYTGGLYKNYSLKRAYYFPESRILALITDQPYVDPGIIYYHGLLIYRLQ